MDQGVYDAMIPRANGQKVQESMIGDYNPPAIIQNGLKNG